MRSLVQLMAYFDWLVLPRTILQSFGEADWRHASEHGATGIAGEAASSLLGTNSFPFFVPLDSGWSLPQIQAVLGTKGIRPFGGGMANNEMFFRVGKRQAAWAQYLMLRAGVPLTHRLLTEPPARDRSRSASGGNPPAGRTEDRSGPIAGLERFLDRVDSFFS